MTLELQARINDNLKGEVLLGLSEGIIIQFRTNQRIQVPLKSFAVKSAMLYFSIKGTIIKVIKIV